MADPDFQPEDYEPGQPANHESAELAYDDERGPLGLDPHIEERLDHALEETFPASDPVSILPSPD